MEDLYIKLLHFLPVGASIMDPRGRIRFINDHFLHGLNESREFMLNADLYSPEYNKKLSTSLFLEVVKEKKDLRRSQIYVNEEQFAYNLLSYEQPVLNAYNEIDFILTSVEYILPMGRIEDISELIDNGSASTFIFESPAMRDIIKRINVIARLPTNILLVGESGVGKDKLAEYIHQISDRRNHPFITVNCAAIAENLIESELFGYEAGAFTGAEKGGRAGLIEQANGGTLFLDEINSLPLGLQGKLLRVLETKMLRRVGGKTEKQVDFRLISASNRNLEDCVINGTFREDLYYRINIFMEDIPPLRERREDILPLLDYFTASFARRYHVHFHMSAQESAIAMNYNWPGNVRELRNFAEQLVVVGSSPILRAQGKTTIFQKNSGKSGNTLKQQMAYYEREIIKEALKSNSSKKGAAQELGIDPAVLSRKIAKYNLRD